jgi:hypothetical protein
MAFGHYCECPGCDSFSHTHEWKGVMQCDRSYTSYYPPRHWNHVKPDKAGEVFFVCDNCTARLARHHGKDIVEKDDVYRYDL